MIEEKLIKSICTTIRNGNLVNRILPLGGKMVMDQPLPFLCVYRYAGTPDYNFVRLVKTQSSYLILEETINVKELITCVTSILTKKFKAVLILELWPDPKPTSDEVTIYCPEKRAPTAVKSLVSGFEKIQKIYPALNVNIQDVDQRHPPHLGPLLFIDETKELGSLLIGIRVPTIFEETSSGNAYAHLFLQFRKLFSETIKKSAFEFLRVQTSVDLSNYLMLGKTRLDNLIRFTDKKLAEINEKMNFLMRVTPVNSIHEWEKFVTNKFEKKPSFNYRLIPLDPELEKRKLFKIRIERIEDPTLVNIFRDKRLELEKQLTMLEERESKNFQFTGQSLYGVVGDEDLKVADRILAFLPEEADEVETLDAIAFAKEAKKEVDQFKETFPGIDLQVKIRKDVSGVMVSKSHLLISEDFSIPIHRVEPLIQHEVGTHILTYCNGYQQPLRQMYAGFAGYDQLQEGLAVLAEYLTDGLTSERLKLLAGRVRAVDCMVKGVEFIETFRILIDKYNFKPKTAYFITMRVFRGGGLTKDAAYLIGLIQLIKYIKNDGDLEILYCGKFHLKHVPIIRELLHRNILKPPFLSHYLKSKVVKERLENLKHFTHLTELITSKRHDHSIHH